MFDCVTIETTDLGNDGDWEGTVESDLVLSVTITSKFTVSSNQELGRIFQSDFYDSEDAVESMWIVFKDSHSFYPPGIPFPFT